MEISRRDRIVRLAPYAVSFLFIAVALITTRMHEFYQHHNDFWDVHVAAARMSWADRETWFNGQYPIIYTLAVRFFGSLGAAGNPAPPAILINIVLSGGIVFLLARMARGFMAPAWITVAVVILAASPPFFRYAVAGGGDPGAVLLFTGGVALVLRELMTPQEKLRPECFLVAGLLMGWAGLFRYHAFVAGALWALSLAAALTGRRRAGLLLAAGLCAGYLPQWTVNLFAGRGLFETGFGPMNVYYLMHGMNWQRVTELRLPGSSLDILAADPGLFARRYFASVWSFKPAWLPPLLALALARDPRHRRAFIVIALWAVAYFALFSATSSGRQVLLALPLSMLALGFSAQRLWESAPNPRRPLLAILMLALAGLGGTYILRDARGVVERAELHRAAVNVEAALLSQGAQRAREVFTTDYDLYFPRLEGLLPRFNGGAVRLGTDWYNAVFPEFPADSPATFLAACRARGVRFVVLNAQAGDLSAWMSDLYHDRVPVEGLPFHAETPSHRIFRVL